VEYINERVRLRVKLIANQVMLEYLMVSEIKAKVKFIGVKGELLILNPLSLHSSSIAPVVLYIGLILLKF
jgi:hypothetical protein